MTLTAEAPVSDFQIPQKYCSDLPTLPRPEVGLILVTGAGGYIGGRLVPELIDRGYKVRVMVRGITPDYIERWPKAELVVADATDKESLRNALEGVAVAYYLIHSLLLGKDKFSRVDLKAARNFQEVASDMGLKRIIYLSGLGNVESKLSPHLRSRTEIARILANGKVPVTALRAAIIIGSGSASYEIIKNLVNNLPFMALPRWSHTKCQPISIRDVIKYLVGVLELEDTSGKMFDIGGRVVLTYYDMIRNLAKIMNKKRLFIPFFFSNTTIYGYFASFYTPVPAPIIQCLMEGVRNEVVCQNDLIKKYIQFEPLSYREAVVLAMTREEQDRISTRWSDAYPPAHELAITLDEMKEPLKYTSFYSIETEKSAGALFNSVCNVGGKKGWFNSNFLWSLRGMIDIIFGGIGTIRGRRASSTLRINDVIDFWRVEDLVRNKKLLLRAEMILPGKAWLEFKIQDKGEKRIISVKPYYYTKTTWGTIYWYIFLPFHVFIFKDLIRQIEKVSP